MTNIIGQNSQTLSRETNLNSPEVEKNSQKNPFPKENKVSIVVGENESPESIQAIINLGKELKIGDSEITREMIKEFVKKALSKGGRGTNNTEIVVKSSDRKIIYRGLGN